MLPIVSMTKRYENKKSGRLQYIIQKNIDNEQDILSIQYDVLINRFFNFKDRCQEL